MKWQLDGCEKGDIVRVKDGAVYHYGIFVSENEVIAFGRVPSYYLTDGKDEKIVVLSTTAQEFAQNALFIERGVPEGLEKKQMRSREEIVSFARSCLGQDGYNVLHNNCEHFVNLCAFGVKRSEQELLLRQRWISRPKTDVYICIDGSVPQSGFVPYERQKSLQEISNETVHKEKKLVWDMLCYAIEKSFYCDAKDIEFKQQANGKWVCDKLHFSLSHTNGVAVVAVSNSPCGVDVEGIDAFLKKCNDKDFAKAFAQKIGCDNVDAKELLKQWTGKESVYKAYGEGRFVPKDIDVQNEDVQYIKVEDYLIAVAGKTAKDANYYLIENGRHKLMFKGEYECI